MTPTQRKAMEQALAALERADKISGYANNKRVIAELRAALAEQPAEQEPFGYLWPTGAHPEFRFTQQERNGVDGMPVYTAPQPAKRVPLTDEEIRDLWSWSMTHEAERTATTQQHAFARAIEAEHGIKGETK